LIHQHLKKPGDYPGFFSSGGIPGARDSHRRLSEPLPLVNLGKKLPRITDQVKFPDNQQGKFGIVFPMRFHRFL